MLVKPEAGTVATLTEGAEVGMGRASSRIVEAGSHAALLAHDGVYARLWNRQSGGFDPVLTAAGAK